MHHASGGNYRQVEAEAYMQESETEASSSSTTSELKELELLTEDYDSGKLSFLTQISF